MVRLYVKIPDKFLHLIFRFGLVWFLCLMAYQSLLGYLMPKPFS